MTTKQDKPKSSSRWSAFIGTGLLFSGSVLGVWNEFKAARTYQSYNYGKTQVRELDALLKSWDSSEPFVTSLAHFTAPPDISSSLPALKVQELPKDPLLQTISHGSIVVLKRKVELYQWVETKRVHKDTVKNDEYAMKSKFHYEPRWVDRAISDVGFRYRQGHRNYGKLPFSSEVFVGGGISIPWEPASSSSVDSLSFYLDSSLVEQLWKRNLQPVRQIIWRDPDDITENPSPRENASTLAVTITKLPEGGIVQGPAIFLRRKDATNIKKSKDEPETSSKSSEIQERRMNLDGKEQTLYFVLPTEESFSTLEKAEKALWKHKVEQDPRIELLSHKLDGEEQIWYQVASLPTDETVQNDQVQRFSSPEAAWLAAQELPEPRTIEQSLQQRSQSSSQSENIEVLMPRIGDVRIQYQAFTIPEVLSGVAEVALSTTTTGSMTSWKAPNGYTVGAIMPGSHSALEVLNKAQSRKVSDQWVVRAGVLLLFTIGWSWMTHRIVAPILKATSRDKKWNPNLALADRTTILGSAGVPTSLVLESIQSPVLKENGIWFINLAFAVLFMGFWASLIWMWMAPLTWGPLVLGLTGVGTFTIPEVLSGVAEVALSTTTTGSMTSWKAPNGYTVGAIMPGSHSALEVLNKAQSRKVSDQWVVRAGVLLLFTIGWSWMTHRIVAPILKATSRDKKWNPNLALADRTTILGSAGVPTSLVLESIQSPVLKENGIWFINLAFAVLFMGFWASLIWMWMAPLTWGPLVLGLTGVGTLLMTCRPIVKQKKA